MIFTLDPKALLLPNKKVAKSGYLAQLMRMIEFDQSQLLHI
jgi:hypothetical protein